MNRDRSGYRSLPEGTFRDEEGRGGMAVAALQNRPGVPRVRRMVRLHPFSANLQRRRLRSIRRDVDGRSRRRRQAGFLPPVRSETSWEVSSARRARDVRGAIQRAMTATIADPADPVDTVSPSRVSTRTWGSARMDRLLSAFSRSALVVIGIALGFLTLEIGLQVAAASTNLHEQSLPTSWSTGDRQVLCSATRTRTASISRTGRRRTRSGFNPYGTRRLEVHASRCQPRLPRNEFVAAAPRPGGDVGEVAA